MSLENSIFLHFRRGVLPKCERSCLASTAFILKITYRYVRYQIREGDGNVIKMITGRDEEEMAGVDLHIEMNCHFAVQEESRRLCRLLFDDKAEYADIVYVHGLCDGSTLRAVAECGRRFPNRRVPYRRVLFTVYENKIHIDFFIYELSSTPRKNAVSTTKLFSFDEISDSVVVFGEMRSRIRHELHQITNLNDVMCIRITPTAELRREVTDQ
ncbi:hypothetical protein ANN_14623 [Periplaneta americana]|uniref:Uncharacterized protein n=1 Tax=Periplaneta americana TaxID=6978 RepID=A0ABQ8SY72_PERAM|nr:hypothetical protein ANN_14623 [Periplaneta americana]